jgi:hypothetical protein
MKRKENINIVKDKGGKEEEESLHTEMFFTDLNAYQNCVRAQREGVVKSRKVNLHVYLFFINNNIICISYGEAIIMEFL